jgi:hypothetical protein
MHSIENIESEREFEQLNEKLVNNFIALRQEDKSNDLKSEKESLRQTKHANSSVLDQDLSIRQIKLDPIIATKSISKKNASSTSIKVVETRVDNESLKKESLNSQVNLDSSVDNNENSNAFAKIKLSPVSQSIKLETDRIIKEQVPKEIVSHSNYFKKRQERDIKPVEIEAIEHELIHTLNLKHDPNQSKEDARQKLESISISEQNLKRELTPVVSIVKQSTYKQSYKPKIQTSNKIRLDKSVSKVKQSTRPSGSIQIKASYFDKHPEFCVKQYRKLEEMKPKSFVKLNNFLSEAGDVTKITDSENKSSEKVSLMEECQCEEKEKMVEKVQFCKFCKKYMHPKCYENFKTKKLEQS